MSSAIRLYDNEEKREIFNYDGDEDLWYVEFAFDGTANFWSYPGDEKTDIKMYVYEGSTSNRVATASNRGKSNRNVLVSQHKVKAKTKYYIRIIHLSGPVSSYKIKTHSFTTRSSFFAENCEYSIERRTNSSGDKIYYRLETPAGKVVTKYLSLGECSKYGTPEYKIKEKAESFLYHLELADAQIERGRNLITPTNIAGGNVATFINTVVNSVKQFEKDDIVDIFVELFEIVPPVALSESIGCLAASSLNLKYCRDRAEEIDNIDRFV